MARKSYNRNLKKQIENLGNDGIKPRCIAALPFIYVILKNSS